MLFWRGKAAAILYAAIIFTVTFIAGTADVFAAVDDHTVQGKTPQGTVISLFDYWVNEQSSPDHGTSNNNSSGGINKSHSLKFSNGQGDGFNGWTGGKAPHSGMLDKCRFVKHMLHHQVRNHLKQFEEISIPVGA